MTGVTVFLILHIIVYPALAGMRAAILIIVAVDERHGAGPQKDGLPMPCEFARAG